MLLLGLHAKLKIPNEVKFYARICKPSFLMPGHNSFRLVVYMGHTGILRLSLALDSGSHAPQLGCPNLVLPRQLPTTVTYIITASRKPFKEWKLS